LARDVTEQRQQVVTVFEVNLATQGCQMVPNLANIAKKLSFPKNLPIFLAIFFNGKNLPFLKGQM